MDEPIVSNVDVGPLQALTVLTAMTETKSAKRALEVLTGYGRVPTAEEFTGTDLTGHEHWSQLFVILRSLVDTLEKSLDDRLEQSEIERLERERKREAPNDSYDYEEDEESDDSGPAPVAVS